MLARVTSTGALDPTFGDHGIAQPPVDLPQYQEICGLAIDANGHILVGVADHTGHPSFQIFRLNASGELDTTFANHGILTDNFGGDAALTKIAVTSDNKLLAIGTIATSNTYESNRDILVARYNL
jgi:uncharacterized delta-60 repeat protein